ncbi:hypothetical protein JMJ35_010146 [Cladonia borealis]|uniref:Ecp2 effector protein domain-containing protein n=1 Tax=Cladonia borealis TaxID=184061 RepID=A0AA39QTU6_9LECA|nr:hypothetical protein JMJ35_010146 [Cladonia borealis]
MPLLVPFSQLPGCALALSFFTIASAFSLANGNNPLNPRNPSCYPASGSALLPPLSERDCLQALGEFERNLPFVVTPILTHDPDKAHLPAYILAPATATWGECMFRADIPPGNDARIDVQDLVYQANVLLAKCVAQADYDGGQCSVEAEGAKIWIKIDFQHLIPLTKVTRVGVGNITNAAGLVLDSSTAETVLSPPAMSGNAEAASSK